MSGSAGSDDAVWTWPARCSLVRHDAPASAECVALRGHDGASIEPALADFHPAAMWIVGPRAGELVTVDRVRDVAVSGTWTLESDAAPIDVWGDAVGAFALTRRHVLGIASSGVVRFEPDGTARRL